MIPATQTTAGAPQAPSIITSKTRYKHQDHEFLRAQNQKKPVNQPEKLISNYVNGLRLMPNGSPYPGIYDIYRTPHVVEIVDNLSPYSRIRNVAVKKSVQNAFTTGVAENIIAYYIGERPAQMMYMTGTDTLLKKFTNSRLQPLIDSCGFQKLIKSQSTKKNNRQTGDTANLKEFPGGRLILGSLQSEADMRQESAQIMMRDEIDLLETQMSSGEGNPLDVSDGRLAAYGDRAKAIDFSTPRETGNSLIDIQYNKGDKRKRFVKCPFCKKEQYLRMGTEKTNYGLKGDYKAGRIERGYYQCFHCRDAIFEHHKIKMFAEGIWLPTIDFPPDPYFRSYHSPAFYSPPGMVSWTEMRKKHDTAMLAGDDGMRAFTNLYLAESFEPSGERPKYETVIEIRSKDTDYKSGVVPDGILWLTAFVDVQGGKLKYKEASSEAILREVEKIQDKHEKSEYETYPAPKALREIPRIELEIMGHGEEHRTASVLYKTFYGRVDIIDDGVWPQLREWMDETGMVFKRKDGFQLKVKSMLIDSGHETDLVYKVCDSLKNMSVMIYPSKGDKPKKEDKLHLTEIDEQRTGASVTRVKLSKSPGGDPIVLINTVYYKGHIYRLLNNKFKEGDEQPPDSHQVPCDYPDEFFKGLRAEEHKRDGSFHNKSGRSNEPLDLFVGNKAASDHYIFGIVENDRYIWKKRYKAAKKPEPTKERLQQLANRDTVTARLKAELIKRGW